jgi:branched-chain amino acid transport system permease protein
MGFNIIYNATGIINFAQGEFVMLGGMIAVTLATVVPLPIAIVGAVLATMAIGALIEIVFIRPLAGPSVLRMIIITIGLSILIREAALLVWGQRVRALPYFTGDEVTSVSILGARVSPQVLWTVGACAAMVLLITGFFRWTMAGKQMRACASNRVAASLCGLPTRNLVTLSFVLSAAMGALAGCVVSPITYTQYNIGTGLAIKGFTVAILGGLGSSLAAVTAGLVLGVVEAFSVSLMPTAYKDTISIAVLLAIMFVRPTGLFAARVAYRP